MLLPIVLLAIFVQTSEQITCPNLGSKRACDSLNELFKNGDPDVTAAVSGNRETIACFVPYEDKFVLISYFKPDVRRIEAIVKTKKPVVGSLRFYRFEDGQLSTSKIILGRWNPLGTDVYFSGNASSTTQGTVDEGEIMLGYSFKNLRGNSTDYTIRIRRSTLRFTETFEAPETDTKLKGHTTQIKNSGYCSEFAKWTIKTPEQ